MRSRTALWRRGGGRQEGRRPGLGSGLRDVPATLTCHLTDPRRACDRAASAVVGVVEAADRAAEAVGRFIGAGATQQNEAAGVRVRCRAFDPEAVERSVGCRQSRHRPRSGPRRAQPTTVKLAEAEPSAGTGPRPRKPPFAPLELVEAEIEGERHACVEDASSPA